MNPLAMSPIEILQGLGMAVSCFLILVGILICLLIWNGWEAFVQWLLNQEGGTRLEKDRATIAKIRRIQKG